MSAHRLTLAVSCAVGALAISAPAFAQPEDPYEYAEPAPEGPVIFEEAPVVQPLPGDMVIEDAGPLPPPPPLAVPPMAAPYPPVHHAPVPYHAPMMHPPLAHAPAMAHSPVPYGHGAPIPPAFDRDEWLDDCRVRIRGVDRKDRGSVIGGLLGGIAGGVVGNRVYDSNRLAGSLIGAGVGGLAGIAIGAAIGAASERRREDECAWHLDRYMAEHYPQRPGVYAHGQPGYGYGYPGYGYGYAGYTLVPVVVAVPQRQVVRETVTEEVIDVPVRARSAPRRYHAAPVSAPDKRVRLIKGK